MQFFGLLIPIIIGYFADEMFTDVIIGRCFGWLLGQSPNNAKKSVWLNLLRQATGCKSWSRKSSC